MKLKPPPINQKDPVARDAHVWVATLRAKRPNGLRCHYCGGYAKTRDHVVPKNRGGLNDWWNLVQCCFSCNQQKDNDMPTCRCVFCVRAIRLFLSGLHAPNPIMPKVFKTEIRKAKYGWMVTVPVTAGSHVVSYWPTWKLAYESVSDVDIPVYLG
ncbi:HNH endonuclease [Microbacterium phage PauloDiaboli]|nr:HNH endonuclease [Microbacterium phage PauloDiaboli]